VTPTDGVGEPTELNAESGTSFKSSLAFRANCSIDIRTTAASVPEPRRTRTKYANMESDNEDSHNAQLDGRGTSSKFGYFLFPRMARLISILQLLRF
jgi:hypothetical protein